MHTEIYFSFLKIKNIVNNNDIYCIWSKNRNAKWNLKYYFTKWILIWNGMEKKSTSNPQLTHWYVPHTRGLLSTDTEKWHCTVRHTFTEEMNCDLEKQKAVSTYFSLDWVSSWYGLYNLTFCFLTKSHVFCYYLESNIMIIQHSTRLIGEYDNFEGISSLSF